MYTKWCVCHETYDSPGDSHLDYMAVNYESAAEVCRQLKLVNDQLRYYMLPYYVYREWVSRA